MGLDIVIPLGKDRQNYNELRFTLRSIEANLSGYRNIYIIGEKPAWLRNVIHIPLNDLTGKKSFSIFRKMLRAAQTEEVSQRFISWADDTYLLSPLHTSEIKDWYDGTLAEWSVKNINTIYRNIIKNTHKLFPDGLFFNVHTPCIYEKERFQELVKYNWSTSGLLIKSTYFNSGESNPVQMKDPKRHKGLFYSTNGLGSEHNWLYHQFNKPSIYEADHKANAEATSGMAETTG